MASSKETKTNNLESDIKGETTYRVPSVTFKEIEKYNEKSDTNKNVMNLQPEDSKEYKDLMKALEEIEGMVLEAKNYTKVLGKNGTIKARISESGKVLTGKVSTKNGNSKVDR